MDILAHYNTHLVVKESHTPTVYNRIFKIIPINFKIQLKLFRYAQSIKLETWRSSLQVSVPETTTANSATWKKSGTADLAFLAEHVS